MNDNDPSERVKWWLSTIIEMAPQLREAGVSNVGVGEFSATLQPKDPPASKFDDVKNDEQIPDGLPAHLDPRTYPGGIVPGFDITPLPMED